VLRAGTTWSWKRSECAEFPVADSWTYTYYLAGKTSLSFSASNGTGEFTVSVAPTTTSAVAAGSYSWELRASLSGAVYTVSAGVFTIVADSNVGTSDSRSHAEIMLAAVEAEIAARVTGDGSAHESYGIGSSGAGARQMTKLSMDALKAMRVSYAAEVQRQRNGGRLPPYRAQAVRP
jgi:hypothetical protein